MQKGIRIVKRPFVLSRFRGMPEGALIQVMRVEEGMATVRRETGDEYRVPTSVIAENTREISRK